MERSFFVWQSQTCTVHGKQHAGGANGRASKHRRLHGFWRRLDSESLVCVAAVVADAGRARWGSTEGRESQREETALEGRRHRVRPIFAFSERTCSPAEEGRHCGYPLWN
jgi:hypothetical protein